MPFPIAFGEPEVGPGLDVGKADLPEIAAMGVLAVPLDREFRWSNPDKLAERTLRPRAKYEVVYTPKMDGKIRRIVRMRDAQLSSVPIVKKQTD